MRQSEAENRAAQAGDIDNVGSENEKSWAQLETLDGKKEGRISWDDLTKMGDFEENPSRPENPEEAAQKVLEQLDELATMANSSDNLLGKVKEINKLCSNPETVDYLKEQHLAKRIGSREPRPGEREEYDQELALKMFVDVADSVKNVDDVEEGIAQGKQIGEKFGLEFPLSDNEESMWLRKTKCSGRIIMAEQGIIAPDVNEAIYDKAIQSRKDYLRGSGKPDDIIPPALENRSPKTRAFWEEETKRAGGENDMSLKIIGYYGFSADDKEELAQIFDEDGKLSEDAFRVETGLTRNMLYRGDNEDWRFLKNNLERISDPVDHLFVKNHDAYCSQPRLDGMDEKMQAKIRGEYKNAASGMTGSLSRQRYIGEVGELTQVFYDDLLLKYPSFASFLDQQDNLYTEKEKYFLDLAARGEDDENAKAKALAIKKLCGNGTIQEWGIGKNTAEKFDYVFAPDGSLNEDFLQNDVIGNNYAEEVVKFYPEQMRENYGQPFLDYLAKDSETREAIVQDFKNRILSSQERLYYLSDGETQRYFQKIYPLAGIEGAADGYALMNEKIDDIYNKIIPEEGELGKPDLTKVAPAFRPLFEEFGHLKEKLGDTVDFNMIFAGIDLLDVQPENLLELTVQRLYQTEEDFEKFIVDPEDEDEESPNAVLYQALDAKRREIIDDYAAIPRGEADESTLRRYVLAAQEVEKRSAQDASAADQSTEYNVEDVRKQFAKYAFQNNLANFDRYHFPQLDKKYLGEGERSILEKYQKLDPSQISQRGKLQAFAKEIDFEQLEGVNFDNVMEALDGIMGTNAIELRRMNGAVFMSILRSEQPQQTFQSMEEIFLKNNLPYAGKVFKTFQLIHPAERYQGDFRLASKRGVLQEMPETGFRSKETVFFNDLMKASIDSNSRSMREWIKNMRAENPKMLRTAYNQTRAGRENPAPSNIDAVELDERIQTTSRYNAADRIVRSFGYQLGLRSLDDLERRMDEKVAAADAKGRARFAAHDFRIEHGDLVKAVKSERLDSMLQEGIVSKEFLNGEVSSDSTPLDADLTRIMEDAEIDGSVRAGIDWKNGHAAFGAMRVNLVMKGDERFVSEEDELRNGYDPEKFGLWDNGNSNHGIRVGFPSTAIDFITFGSDILQTPDDQNFLFAEIAKNGFYIPVVDQRTGECIFSPDDYDQLRQKLSGLERYGMPTYQFAADEYLATPELVNLAKDSLEHDHEVEAQRNAIYAELGRVLSENYDGYRGIKAEADGDLSPGYVELIDTGSTGRGTSVPGAQIDFDFIMRVDAPIYNDSGRKTALERSLRRGLQFAADKSTSNGLRLKDVQIPGLAEPTDLDISLVQRTNRMEFSTDQAVQERLRAMQEQDPARTQLVIANIINAKKLLKSVNAYKPKTSRDTPNSDEKGGLGGVGVENWILQNGGSLRLAAERFLDAAERANGDFETFKALYPIWDAGQNHFSVRDNEKSAENVNGGSYKIPFDNFVTRNMDAGGFTRMRGALQQYLAANQ